MRAASKTVFRLVLGRAGQLHHQSLVVAGGLLALDSIMAKLPGKTLLIQETGLQRELNPDETRAARQRTKRLFWNERLPRHSSKAREHRVALEHEFLHDAVQRNTHRRGPHRCD